MKNITRIAIILLSFLFLNMNSFAQEPNTFLFSGELMDIEAKPICQKNALVSIEFSSSNISSYKYEENIHTNGSGKFLIIVNDIPEIFSDRIETEEIEITVYFSSDEDWLEGGEFSVKYVLNKLHNQPFPTDESNITPPQFNMKRFEGQGLNTSTIQNVYKFDDSYSFAYLKSSFMLSMNPEITDPMTILSITQEAAKKAQISNDSTKSRGIKSGFAVGGYNKSTKKDNK